MTSSDPQVLQHPIADAVRRAERNAPWLVKRLLEQTRHQDPSTFMGRNGRDPYLTRYYFLRTTKEDEGMVLAENDEQPEGERIVKQLAPFLHFFHRGDDDYALHNHPWVWGLSFILTGGYMEERRVGNTVIRMKRKPLTFNFLKANDFHRVELLDPRAGCWTLFLAGPRCQDWSFWDRASRETTPWREFIYGKPNGVHKK